MEEVNDALLYRKIYTNIFSQQMQSENRLHRLMKAAKDLDETFHEHLDKVRAKVENDRRRVQKFGEFLVLLKEKDMKMVKNTHGKDRKTNGLTTLLNMESVRNQFKLDQNTSKIETSDQVNNNKPKADQSIPNQNPFCHTIIDPKEIEVGFEQPPSQNLAKRNKTSYPTHSHTETTGLQGHTRKCGNKQLWLQACRNQNLKDDLPKRVSFNDIPDIIAAQEIGNESTHDLVNTEIGWSSDYSEDEPEDTVVSKRYHEPPPDFNHYSYHDRNRKYSPETSRKTREQGRSYNDRKGERIWKETNTKSLPPKSSKPGSNRQEVWNPTHHEGDSPFKSPWEGVVSTSLQRQRNYSTQAVPSSTTKNENDIFGGSKDESDQETVKTTSDPGGHENFGSKITTTTTANLFTMEQKEHKKFEKWLNLNKREDSEVNLNEDFELYDHVDPSKRDYGFIRDDALAGMRRQSWQMRRQNKKQKIRKLSDVLRLPLTKTARAPQPNRIKGDKKEFHVNKKVRRRMSVRPLPDTPDITEIEHALKFTTADSLDTFQ